MPSVSAVKRFVEAARSHGLVIPVLASVAVFTDIVSAAVLEGFELDHRLVADVVNAADPVEAGIEAAVDEACALLSIDGVTSPGSPRVLGPGLGAQIKAEVGARIRAGHPS